MPNGRVKHIHVVAHATRNENGDVDFVGAVMDVTEAKEREDRIRLAQTEREQLEQRLRQAREGSGAARRSPEDHTRGGEAARDVDFARSAPGDA